MTRPNQLPSKDFVPSRAPARVRWKVTRPDPTFPEVFRTEGDIMDCSQATAHGLVELGLVDIIPRAPKSRLVGANGQPIASQEATPVRATPAAMFKAPKSKVGKRWSLGALRKAQKEKAEKEIALQEKKPKSRRKAPAATAKP